MQRGSPRSHAALTSTAASPSHSLAHPRTDADSSLPTLSTSARPSTSSRPSLPVTSASQSSGGTASVGATTTGTPQPAFDWGNLSAPATSLGPGRPAPAIPVNIFAGPPSTAQSSSSSRPHALSTAAMRPFTTSLGNPSARQSVRESDGVTSPLGIKGDPSREWTYFGVDFVVGNVAQHAADQQMPSAPPLSPWAESAPSFLTRRPQSGAAVSLEIFSSTFGDGRWKVELYRDSQERKQNLTLSIICLLIDTTLSTVTVPATVIYGIREPKQAASRKLGASRWLYQRSVTAFTFSALKDSVDDPSFPPLDELLQNDRVRQQDSFVLSIQIQSPMPTVEPLIEGARLVPHTLLAGMRGLLDDRSTGDVLILTYECRQPNREVASQVSNDEDACLFRKRSLYAHGAILKARSAYFRDMLGDVWAETTSAEASPTAAKAIVKIDDFDFQTVYWLLHYLYTDDISFESTEDVRRQSTETLPQGWTAVSDQLSWDDFYAHEVHAKLGRSGSAHPRSVSGDSVSISGGTEDGASVVSSTNTNTTSSVHHAPKSQASGTPRRVSSTSSPSALSKGKATTGRVSGGSVSGRVTSLSNLVRPPSSIHTAVHSSSAQKDPHAHPAAQPAPASALSMYKIAHRYSIPQLAELALEHLVLNLTPKTAFPLLLSTPLWPDLHKAVKQYALQHFAAVSAEPEMARCYAEVSEGLWPQGGDVLLEFTLAAVAHVKT